MRNKLFLPPEENLMAELGIEVGNVWQVISNVTTESTAGEIYEYYFFTFRNLKLRKRVFAQKMKKKKIASKQQDYV